MARVKRRYCSCWRLSKTSRFRFGSSAGCTSIQTDWPGGAPRAMLRDFFNSSHFCVPRTGSHFRAAINYACPARLDSKDKLHSSSMNCEFHGLGSQLGCPANVQRPLCYGYGAGRRLSHSTLSQPEQADATESLYVENVNLLNAEEWLLRLDYRPPSHRVPQRSKTSGRTPEPR